MEDESNLTLCLHVTPPPCRIHAGSSAGPMRPRQTHFLYTFPLPTPYLIQNPKMGPPLDNLPSTVLIRVCDYLDRDHTSSLAAFARTSKSSHAAATVFLFRTIKFGVSSLNHIAGDVQRSHEMLQRTRSFGRVHCLIIDCAWPQDDSDGSHPRDQRPYINITAEERGY